MIKDRRLALQRIRIRSRMPSEGIVYSERYEDQEFEYRHVTLPADLAKLVPRNHLMTETEWRNLGRVDGWTPGELMGGRLGRWRADGWKAGWMES